MGDFVLIAGGTALLVVSVSLIPPGNPHKKHFLDGVQNPRTRRIAGLAVGVLSAACGLLGLVFLGSALIA